MCVLCIPVRIQSSGSSFNNVRVAIYVIISKTSHGMRQNSNLYWGHRIHRSHLHGGNRQSLNVNRLIHIDKIFCQGEIAHQIMSVNHLTVRIIDAKGKPVDRRALVTRNVILGWHAYLEIDFLTRLSVTN
jgi:hypothetical protein